MDHKTSLAHCIRDTSFSIKTCVSRDITIFPTNHTLPAKMDCISKLSDRTLSYASMATSSRLEYVACQTAASTFLLLPAGCLGENNEDQQHVEPTGEEDTMPNTDYEEHISSIMTETLSLATMKEWNISSIRMLKSKLFPHERFRPTDDRLLSSFVRYMINYYNAGNIDSATAAAQLAFEAKWARHQYYQKLQHFEREARKTTSWWNMRKAKKALGLVNKEWKGQSTCRKWLEWTLEVIRSCWNRSKAAIPKYAKKSLEIAHESTGKRRL